ncbi:MAG: hypothetical protein IIV12_04340 [Bacteroidales bacterium]|nr:hypothetical protein [Bacteroidales bacterium]
MSRKFYLLLVLLLCGLKMSAQESVFFAPDPANARWSYIEYDADGNQQAVVFQSVEKMEGDAVNGKVRIRLELIKPSAPKDTVKSMVFYRFKDGEYMVDMSALFEEDFLADILESAAKEESEELSEEKKKEAVEAMKNQIKISGEIRGIPRYPKVGKLPDYEFQMKFSIINMKVNGEQRKISRIEKLTTPAGTFDCFVLEETVTTRAMMQKEVEKTISWYAHGVGLVKEASYDKNGKLQSSTVLNSINW